MLKILGYTAFGLSCLLLNLYLTFPAEALGQRMAYALTHRTQGRWHVGWQDISMDRFTGVKARKVLVQHQERPGGPVLTGIFPEVCARIRLLSLLWMRPSMDMDVVLNPGRLWVRWSPGRDGGMDIHIKADAVALASLPLLNQWISLPVEGIVQGQVTLVWDTEVQRSHGDLSLDIQSATVGPGSVMGFSLPRIDMGGLALSAELKEGQARILSFQQHGGHVALKAMARMQLRPMLMTSLTDLCIKARVDPAFLNQNPKIKSALQLAEMQLKKDPTGFLNVPFTGPLDALRLSEGPCRL